MVFGLKVDRSQSIDNIINNRYQAQYLEEKEQEERKKSKEEREKKLKKLQGLRRETIASLQRRTVQLKNLRVKQRRERYHLMKMLQNNTMEARHSSLEHHDRSTRSPFKTPSTILGSAKRPSIRREVIQTIQSRNSLCSSQQRLNTAKPEGRSLVFKS